MTPSRLTVFPPVACLLALILSTLAGSSPALAGSLSQKEVQILAKAIGFLVPPPSGDGIVAIAYDPADPASKQDAQVIAGYFGDGLKAGAAVLKPRIVEVSQLSAGGFIAVVAAGGVRIDQVSAATKALHVACITGDAAAVQSGKCVMSVKTEPKIEILISKSAAAGSSVAFSSAFLLMAHEI